MCLVGGRMEVEWWEWGVCESMQVVLRGWVSYIKGVCGYVRCITWRLGVQCVGCLLPDILVSGTKTRHVVAMGNVSGVGKIVVLVVSVNVGWSKMCVVVGVSGGYVV